MKNTHLAHLAKRNHHHPAVIAHRGASLAAPENTLPAFELAITQGADAIELDTKLTQDGVPVVLHDATLDRTTNGSGALSNWQWADVQQLDAGAWFGSAFVGTRIPSLESVLETVRDRVWLNIELTNYTTLYDDLPVKVIQLVQAFNLSGSVLFSSFNPLVLKRLAKCLPTSSRGLLTVYGGQPPTSRQQFYTSRHVSIEQVTPQLIEAQHRRRRAVLVYTVNDPQEMRRMSAAGVDGIFTDDPALACKTLAEVSILSKP